MMQPDFVSFLNLQITRATLQEPGSVTILFAPDIASLQRQNQTPVIGQHSTCVLQAESLSIGTVIVHRVATPCFFYLPQLTRIFI